MHNKQIKKRFLSGIMLFFLFFSLFSFTLLQPKNADAAVATAAGQASSLMSTVFNGLKSVFNWAKDRVSTAYQYAKEHAAAVAGKAALNNFLNQLATDTATWMATGDEGNKPLFITEGWGAYLENAADRAAGDFIMTMGTEWDKGFIVSDSKKDLSSCYEDCKTICTSADWSDSDSYPVCKEDYAACGNSCRVDYNASTEGVNDMGTTFGSIGQYGTGGSSSIISFLCEPDIDVKLRLMGGISEIKTPDKPKCTISSAKKNWDEFVNDDDFLSDFQVYWEPGENDVGIGLSLYSNFLTKEENTKASAEAERIANKGIKPVTNLVGKILTPATIVESMGKKPITEGTKVESVDWDDIVVNAIATFASTLMGELLDKWIKEGISGGDSSGSSYNWLTDNSTDLERDKMKTSDVALAKEKFSKIFKAELSGGEAYSILGKLMICPDPQSPGPTDCVIDEEFAQAVERQLTVQEAIDEGYLKTDVPFGFINKELEPGYNQGYPYRSLIILRKYRIIPVGWELAAQFIGKYGGRTYNIQEIVNEYNTVGPFYKLIDPSWVLKAPEMYCSIEGYGENLTGEEIAAGIDLDEDGSYDGEGDILPKIVIDRDIYCADEKSCIKEDDKGNCLFYGYCSEEKRLFDFNGDKCEPQFSNCQEFATYDGGRAFYTKNSLDFSNCDSDSAGCDWYCTSRNPSDNAWACYEPGRDISPVGIDTVVADINDIDQDGDLAEVCTVPAGGVQCFLDDSNGRLTTGDVNATTPAGPLLAHSLNSVNDIYLDNGAIECKNSEEGCHEYIRTKPNLGTNLLLNSSFEGFDTDGDGNIVGAEEWRFWSMTGNIDNANAYFGSNSFAPVGVGNIWQENIKTGYGLAGRKFVLSLYARGTCDTSPIRFDSSDGSVVSEEIILEDANEWKRYSVALTFPYYVPSYETEIDVKLGLPPVNMITAGCLIDAVQLEEVRGIDNSPNQYNEYQENNLLYTKKAPYYYDCDKYTIVKDFNNNVDCENNGFYWRSNDDICVEGGYAECADFALECNIDDIGCDLYKPKNGDPEIPGVVSSEDFCPSSCDGYSTYKQSKTFFDLENFPEYFIAGNEKKCPASAEGCSEFTNLDKVDEEGEALEYYTYLRPCKAIDGDCSSFYSWVGSEASGFQLKAHLLQDDNFDGAPDMLIDNEVITYITVAADCIAAGHVWTGQCEGGPVNMLGECDDPTWDELNNGENDVISNPECYEFYSENEVISYIHYKNTKTCSDDCSPYRKTRSTPADCGANNNWGDWITLDVDNADGDNDNTTGIEVEYCLYEGLAEESISCGASNDGCYEYQGSTSNNVRNVINDNFESGVGDWVADEGLAGGGVDIALSSSAESLARGGHSLRVASNDTDDRVMYPLKMECGGVIDTNGDGFIDLDPVDANLYCETEESCECQSGGETVCMVSEGDTTCLYKSSLLPGRSYTVSFWGKGSGDLTVRFSSAVPGDEFAAGNISLSSKWMEYSLGPVFIHDNWDMNVDIPAVVSSFNDDYKEVIAISGFNAGDSYIDNFILKEIRDNLFIVKPADNIWHIPEICNQDNDGNYAPQFMLGCKAYGSETEKTDVYLKSFHHLCSEDVVGCESLIDTANSASPLEEIFNFGSSGEITVLEDKFISLVNDKNKKCKEENKGCVALGYPSYSYNQHGTYNDGSIPVPDDGAGVNGLLDDSDDLYKYVTKYLINDPDTYIDSLCDYDNVGCDKFETETGSEFYFKDPKSQRINESPLACEYKSVEFGEEEGWYIEGTPENNPNCPTDLTGTGIEYPAQNLSVNGRLVNWTGQCSAKLDSCTEYVDPISLISKNIVFNSDFVQDVDGNSMPDGWVSSGGFYRLEELLRFKQNTAYTIVAQDSDGLNPYEVRLDGSTCNLTTPIAGICSLDTSISCTDDIDCGASGPCVKSITIDPFAPSATLSFDGVGQFSGIFYSGDSFECNLYVSEDFVDNGGKIQILKTGLYYYLDNSIDKSGCDGYTDYYDGCVVFNSRDINDGNNGKLADLIYDADLLSEIIPSPAQPPSLLSNNDSNLLIKTRPNRECGEWLYCKSLVKSEDSDGNERQMCLEIGLCDSISNNGLCDGFPVSMAENKIFSEGNFRDSTGYSKVGHIFGDINLDGVANEDVVGYYPFEKMTQTGGKVLVPNGDFEVTAEDGYPVGWIYEDQDNNPYQLNYFSTIRDPITSQSEGLDFYAPSGKNYLKIDADESIVTEMIDVNFFTQTTGIDNYFIDASINTRNIYGGNVVIEVLSYNQSSSLTGTTVALTLGEGNDWRELSSIIPLFGGTDGVKIKITADDDAEGYFYVDNVNIRPTLTTTEGINTVITGGVTNITNWNVGPSLDPNMGGVNCSIIGPPAAPEGTYRSILNSTGDWILASGGGIAYGLGSNKIVLDGTGGAYDGMLYSDPITLGPEASILHLWRNVRVRSFDRHQDILPNGAPDAYRLEVRDGNPASPTYFDVLPGGTIESWEGGNQAYIGVDEWFFGGSIDPVFGPCGEDATPMAPAGTRNDVVIASGNWDVPATYLYDGTAYGFTDDLAGNLDGSNAGGYDGMLSSNAISLPDDVGDIHIWRNVRLRSFDFHAGSPDAYYLEIRDADAPATVLQTIESWESPLDGSDTDAYASGVITENISSLGGRNIIIVLNIVGHSAVDSCNDGVNGDHIAQIGDVYIHVGDTGDGDANIYGDINFDISAYAGTDIILSSQLIGHGGTACTDGPSDDGLLQLGNAFVLDGEDIDISRYVNQSCRAYPREDSLACDYYDEKGVKNIGWKGYCLEYDRAPGNSDQCLLWWPVDLLLGEGSNEDEIGYSGKKPVYYGVGSENLLITTNTYNLPLTCEHRTGPCTDWNATDAAFRDTGSDINVIFPSSLDLNNDLGVDLNNFLHKDYIDNIVIGRFTLNASHNINLASGSVWYDSDCCWNSGSCVKAAARWDENDNLLWVAYGNVDNSAHTSCYTNQHRNTLDVGLNFLIPYISEVAQVVTPFGNNKYWSDRVYAESDYIVPSGPLSQYFYDNYSPPFGSLVNLIPDNDPERWNFNINSYPNFFIDGNNNIIEGDGDILGKSWDGMADVNQTIGSYLSRLFAKSYGHWTWDISNSKYEKLEGSGWSPPDNICTGSPPVRPKYDFSTLTCGGGNCFSCPGDTCDWCGVPPKIENVKLDEKRSGNYYINNSGSVNLTFNSIVDSNQSPLVMYVVDWGDGTDSNPNYVLGSGISINNNPSEDNPHSFFHLYGYWDMLAKDIQSDSIDCASAGSDLFFGATQCLDDSPCCATRIKTKIKDNWGWCNDGVSRNDCNTFVEYNGYVVVSQFNKDLCVPVCNTNVGCRNVDPSSPSVPVSYSEVNESEAACCGNGWCYECDILAGYEWDEDLGQCTTPCNDTCDIAGGDVCLPSANTPLDSSIVGAVGTCCDPADSCFACDPGYSWNGSQCVFCSDTCSGLIDITGTSYEAAGCSDPLGPGPIGSAGYMAGGQNCCNGDACYYCPLGQYWNGSSCELTGSGMCGDQNGTIFGPCDPPCFDCNMGPGAIFTCEPPLSPESSWYINDTNSDSMLTAGEDVTGYICVPDNTWEGSVWSLFYNGAYLDANDCSDVANLSAPANNCKVLPGCEGGWNRAYDTNPIGGCGITSDWEGLTIPSGLNYISRTLPYTDCCYLCDSISQELRFDEVSLGISTSPDVIFYNNDDCFCDGWTEADPDSGCNDVFWINDGSDFGFPGLTCALTCLGPWQVNGASNCCINDPVQSSCLPGVDLEWLDDCI
jgi:hypothetical protein